MVEVDEVTQLLSFINQSVIAEEVSIKEGRISLTLQTYIYLGQDNIGANITVSLRATSTKFQIL